MSLCDDFVVDMLQGAGFRRLVVALALDRVLAEHSHEDTHPHARRLVLALSGGTGRGCFGASRWQFPLLRMPASAGLQLVNMTVDGNRAQAHSAPPSPQEGRRATDPLRTGSREAASQHGQTLAIQTYPDNQQ